MKPKHEKMKKIFFALVVCLSLTGMSTTQLQAQDGFFGDARTVEYTRFALGVQPIIYTQPENEFMMMFRAGYGIQPELSFHGKVGVFRDDIYIGGHLKYRLLSELVHPVTASVIGGAYLFNEVGLKLSGVISKNLGQFSLYTGLSLEPIFTTPAQAPLMIPVGVDIPISDQTDFIFEADLALNDVGERYQSIHFGLKFRL